MSLVKGIHHVSMKCCNEQEYNKVIKFYNEVLQLEVVRKWDAGVMFDTGNGIIEVFNNGDTKAEKGIIKHFAFATDNVDQCIERVKDAGYEVFVEPKDIEIASIPPFPVRIAFCKGPLGEEIEFFQER